MRSHSSAIHTSVSSSSSEKATHFLGVQGLEELADPPEPDGEGGEEEEAKRQDCLRQDLIRLRAGRDRVCWAGVWLGPASGAVGVVDAVVGRPTEGGGGTSDIVFVWVGDVDGMGEEGGRRRRGTNARVTRASPKRQKWSAR